MNPARAEVSGTSAARSVSDDNAERARVSRFEIVDAVKGIAIVLMVFGHTEQGCMHRQWWDGDPHVIAWIKFADAFIYSFHMPAFFFVSGLFLTRSIEKRGARLFVLEKVKALLYPYVLWGLIEGLSDPLTDRFRSGHNPFSIKALLLGLAEGNASWFLITLFLCTMFALAIYRLPRWTQLILALGAACAVPDMGIQVLYAPFVNFPFVLAGMLFGAGRLNLLEKLPRRVAWPGFACLLVFQAGTIWFVGETTRWNKLPIGLAGSAMLIFFCRAMDGTGTSRLFVWFGEASIAIFLVAPFCQGFARELVLHLLRTTAPAPQLLIPTVVASVIPALLWWRQKPLHIEWLFRWPSRFD